MNDDADDEVGREERAIYVIIIAAGAPVTIAAAIGGGVIDSGTTLCLVIVVAGVLGLLWRYRRVAPIPRAITSRRRRAGDSQRRPR
ncbi:MAG: hypothetical protein ABI867_31635 [Kofleriaceae bacterium]